MTFFNKLLAQREIETDCQTGTDVATASKTSMIPAFFTKKRMKKNEEEKEKPEEEFASIEQEELNLDSNNEGDQRLFLINATTIEHKINSQSPFWKISKSDIENGLVNFEISVMINGIVECTGMPISALTSYTHEDVDWGCRFENLWSNGINDKAFNKTVKMDIWKESTLKLHLLMRDIGNLHNAINTERNKQDGIRSDHKIEEMEEFFKVMKSTLPKVSLLQKNGQILKVDAIEN